MLKRHEVRYALRNSDDHTTCYKTFWGKWEVHVSPKMRAVGIEDENFQKYKTSRIVEPSAIHSDGDAKIGQWIF